MKKIVISLVVALSILGMTGCTQPNMTDSQRTKAEGTGVGALGGAIIGGLIGGRKGAMYGAALGGVAGYAYGSHVADQKSKYARAEDWLDASINEAVRVNKGMHAYNKKLASEISKMKKMARLYKQKKVSRSAYVAQQNILKKHRSEAKKRLSLIEKELKAQKKVLKDPSMKKNPSQQRKLARAVRKMEKEKSTLSRQSRTIANMSVSSAV